MIALDIKSPEGLPFVRRDGEDRCECWDLDVPGIMVWIKHYSEEVDKDNPFSGWRIGVGCSPGQRGYATLEQALAHAGDRAREVARWRVDEKRKEYQAALKAQARVKKPRKGTRK